MIEPFVYNNTTMTADELFSHRSMGHDVRLLPPHSATRGVGVVLCRSCAAKAYSHGDFARYSSSEQPTV